MSKAAAEAVAPGSAKMMDRIEEYLRHHSPASPEEITAAIALPDEHLLLTSVRARVTQLRRLGRVVDSGERSLGESLRCMVRRVRLTTPAEYAAFVAAQGDRDE